MHVFNYREGADCPKRPYWDENIIIGKMYRYLYESSSFLNARCPGTDVAASGKRFQYLTTLHVKLFPSSSGSPGLLQKS